jgi:hypothetical protein
MPMIDGTVTKAEFATHLGVSAGRISQMIKAGQISPASLKGEGRSARVIVDKASADLRRSLDPAQSHGLNGMATRSALAGAPSQPAQLIRTETPSSSGPPATPPASPAQSQPAAPMLTLDNTADLIGREKLRQAEIATRRMERDEALAEGRFVLADDHRAAVASAASKVLATIESGLSDMADAIASAHSLPPRDVLHTLTQSFRGIRETAANAFAGQREAILAAEAEALARAAEEDDETE